MASVVYTIVYLFMQHLYSALFTNKYALMRLIHRKRLMDVFPTHDKSYNVQYVGKQYLYYDAQYECNTIFRHYSVNACLLPVCSLHGLSITTVEGIGNVKNIHPIQVRTLSIYC